MIVADLEKYYRKIFEDENPSKYALDPAGYLLYLNEALAEACIRSDLIFDKSSSFCTIPVIANTSIYTLEPSIYGLCYVRLMNANGIYKRLVSSTYEDLDSDNPSWREETGEPEAYVHYRNIIEITPVPDAAFTLKLECYRTAELLVSSGDEPEISDNLHISLNDWVLFRQYGSPDFDFANPRKSAEHLAKFEKVFGFRPLAATHTDKYTNRPHKNRPSAIV